MLLTPNGKPSELTRRVPPVHVDLIDVGGRRPVVAPVDRRLNVIGVPFEDGLDAPVREVPNVAVDAEGLDAALGGGAKVDPLNSTGDEDVSSTCHLAYCHKRGRPVQDRR